MPRNRLITSLRTSLNRSACNSEMAVDNANPTVLDATDLPTRRRKGIATESKEPGAGLRAIMSMKQPLMVDVQEVSSSDVDSEDDDEVEPIDEQEIFGMFAEVVSFCCSPRNHQMSRQDPIHMSQSRWVGLLPHPASSHSSLFSRDHGTDSVRSHFHHLRPRAPPLPGIALGCQSSGYSSNAFSVSSDLQHAQPGACRDHTHHHTLLACNRHRPRGTRPPGAVAAAELPGRR